MLFMNTGLTSSGGIMIVRDGEGFYELMLDHRLCRNCGKRAVGIDWYGPPCLCTDEQRAQEAEFKRFTKMREYKKT